MTGVCDYPKALFLPPKPLSPCNRWPEAKLVWPRGGRGSLVQWQMRNAPVPAPFCKGPVDMLLSYTADGAPGVDVDRKGVNIQDPGPAGAAREMLVPDFPPGFLHVLQFRRAKPSLSCSTECDKHQVEGKVFLFGGKSINTFLLLLFPTAPVCMLWAEAGSSAGCDSLQWECKCQCKGEAVCKHSSD